MFKIILAILTAAAFFYALWLVVFRRPLPDPRQANGLKKRFRLAVLLLVSAMAAPACITCYAPASTTQQRAQAVRREMLHTLKAVWRTLDSSRNEEFRRELDAVVNQNGMNKHTADLLAVAYAELARHKGQYRGDSRILCYSPLPPNSPVEGREEALHQARENALKQLELLAKARRFGRIDQPTADKAEAALYRELELFNRITLLDKARDQHSEDPLVINLREEQTVKQYETGQLFAAETAMDAAGIIIELEQD